MMADFAWYQPKQMFQLLQRVASTACWTGLYFAGVSRIHFRIPYFVEDVANIAGHHFADHVIVS